MSDDIIIGTLKPLGLLDTQYFTSIQDLINKLPSVYCVELPASASGATLGNVQPDDGSRNKPWYRFDNAGSFIGIYVYSVGAWRQIVPAPNQIIKMYGDSRAVPSGYSLADALNPKIGAAMATALQAFWVRDPTNTFWAAFEVTFDGY